MPGKFITVDGNQAASDVAYQTSEVIAIYPITPASPMGEFSDAWSAAERPNIFGSVPQVIEMQSEAGAAGAAHGALQAGSLTTTFTASQGLLLMLPNMFKIAGEMSPTVFHVAARTLATHALSIFGDHNDVMAARSTGWAMLCSTGVQEAQDLALIAQTATLRSRIPFLHFFDGFRTSHEINKIEPMTDEVIRAMIDEDLVQAHYDRRLTPDKPVLRGTAQNPDVFFQAREAVNAYYDRTPEIVRQAMDEFAALTGRQYQLIEYLGDPRAKRVVVMMGSGCGAAEEAVEWLEKQGEEVGLMSVHLYRPFPLEAFAAVLPETVERIAVLDRTKEPGAIGEPLYQDVVAAVDRLWQDEAYRSRTRPIIIGGRYGLSSKEFTPSMAAAVWKELESETPRCSFSVGITDDVTWQSLDWSPKLIGEPDDVVRAVFYGLGSDGTVGANKNSVKIIGQHTDYFVQGYFVYDSKKAGAITKSHLRLSPRPIRSTYLIDEANFVACHQFHFLDQIDVLQRAGQNATFLLNSTYSADNVWAHLPREVQEVIVERQLKFYVINAAETARQAGLGHRINTVMQTCFFALADLLPQEEAIEYIREAIRKTYGRRGKNVVDANIAAVDMTLAGLQRVEVPSQADSEITRRAPVPANTSDFVQRITSVIMAGQGDRLPVSAMPIDGTFPTGTAKYEKRSIAQEIPIWDADLCIQCGLCSFVCPHAAIRSKVYPEAELASQPEDFESKPWSGRDRADHYMTIQVAPDDCTGCGVCVDICPARSKEIARHKAINMEPIEAHVAQERENFEFFLTIPELDRTQVDKVNVKGSQLLEPLFEFSGACAGCGETPYLRLLTQLLGDRMLVANATGCSSIYGGNLPTTPWTTNGDGRGPSWSNSLFEDNAEFGLGMRIALDQQHELASLLLRNMASEVGEDFVTKLLTAPQGSELEIGKQRQRIVELRSRLKGNSSPTAQRLDAIADVLVSKSVWIIGGDGWAYDIGFGGLDHVLATGRNVNVLVLDTEVYSNTGGQASKATPRAAIAKFAAKGKSGGKKDLGLLAMQYGNVYVAQIALAGQPLQTVRAFEEAASFDGPSLILAYSQCVAHGIDMSKGMSHQKEAISSGYWPLYRYDPRLANVGGHPFHLDSRAPKTTFRDFAIQEARFAMLERTNPERAKQLFELAQRDITERYRYYSQLAGVERELVEADSNGNGQRQPQDDQS